MEFAHYAGRCGYGTVGLSAGAGRCMAAAATAAPTAGRGQYHHRCRQRHTLACHSSAQPHCQRHPAPYRHSHLHITAAGRVWRCARRLAANHGARRRKPDDPGDPFRRDCRRHCARQLSAPGKLDARPDPLFTAGAAANPALWPAT